MDKLIVHIESIVIDKLKGWDKLTKEEQYQYCNTQVCLTQPTVNDWEVIETKS